MKKEWRRRGSGGVEEEERRQTGKQVQVTGYRLQAEGGWTFLVL